MLQWIQAVIYANIPIYRYLYKVYILFWKGGITVPKRPENTYRSSVYLTPYMLEQLKALAAASKTTVSGTIRQILLKHLTEQK